MKIRKHRVRNRNKKGILSFFKRKNRRNKPSFHWKRWLIGCVILGISVLTLYTIFILPSVKNAEQLSFAQSTIIYDREALNPEEDPNDHILYVIHGDENRDYIPLEKISPHLVNATLAIEDDGFYKHFGFDVGGIVKAVFAELGMGKARGGSTITQQLVKNSFLSRERTYTRKLNELLLSLKVEANYSKDEILELYLNKIPYGSNAHGIEAASRTFFGKSASELTIAESAILASLPVAPTRFSPYGSKIEQLMGYEKFNEETGEKEYKKGRKDLVLQRMLDLKMITFDEFQQAWAESKTIEFKTHRIDIKAPHFVFLVREQLENKFGKDFLKNGGLRIYTTLDPKLQEIAETTVVEKSAHYPSTYGAKNAALVSLNPDNGQILAYVGGRDYFDTENDGQVDVLTSERQPGSSYKPYAYAAAFLEGFVPSTVVFDVETDFGGNYRPQNFDGAFSGPVSFRDALNRSLNIPAVKAAYLATPAKVMALAEKAGVLQKGSAEDHGVAIGIGVSEVQPLSHISAYQNFVNSGTYYEPSTLLEVRDAQGKVLETFDKDKQEREGIDPDAAALVRHILTDESTRPTTDGFDWNKLLQLPGIDNGAKTGTSNRIIRNPEFNTELPEDKDENPKFITTPGDSWTIGFSPHMITGVWVGNNRGEPMRPGATGLTVAAPIWRSFMINAHEKLFEQDADPEKPYANTPPLQLQQVNKFSGKIATDKTPKSLVKEEVFASISSPVSLDDSVYEIEIDRRTGLPANRLTPRHRRSKQFILKLESIKPDLPHWNNPVLEWISEHPQFMSSLGTIEETPDEPLLESTFANEDPTVSKNVEKSTRQLSNPPTIEIISPRNNGTVGNGIIEVRVSVKSRYDIKGVEFYLNDTFVTSSNTWPYTTSLDLKSLSKATIKAIAVDKRGAYSEHEIKVNIDSDTQGPEIKFLGPIGNQRIPLNATIHALADITDFGSGVKVAEFFLDDQSLGFDQTAPYEKTFTSSKPLGKRIITIKAWDLHGNISEKSIPIMFDREKTIQESSPQITNIYNYRTSVSVDIVVPNMEKYEWVEIIAEQGNEILYSKQIADPQKFMQFQIPKNNKGRAKLRLYAKPVDNENIEESRIKFIDL